MIAAEPTRLTSVGEESPSRPGSRNCSITKNANASPTRAARPRSRATATVTMAKATVRATIGTSRS
jgi:hypothetical protein